MSVQATQPQHQPTASSGAAAGSPVQVTCPACGQAIHVIPVTPPAPASTDDTAARPPSQRSALLRLGTLAYDQLRSRRTSDAPGVDVKHEVGSAPQGRRPVWTIIGLIALMLLVSGTAIWWGRSAPQAASSAATQTPVAAVSRAPGETEAARAAIIATLSGYNRAETEAATLLSIEPLLPFIDPTSPFAQKREAHLAERRQQNAPHRTMLVRWAVGAIDVRGTMATVVTQETWSNQEAGAVAAEHATVRVTYTLRWEASAGRWLIVESEQMGV